MGEQEMTQEEISQALLCNCFSLFKILSVRCHILSWTQPLDFLSARPHSSSFSSLTLRKVKMEI